MEVLLLALGGETAAAACSGPLGRRGDGRLRACSRTAGPRSSRSRRRAGSGSWPTGERDAEAASTRGTGELIAAAVEAGAEVVLVGGRRQRDDRRRRRARSRRSSDAGGLRGARARRAVRRAHAVRARGRGVRPAEGRRRRRRCSGWQARSTRSRATLPRDPRGVPMTGAAGGLAGGLWAAFDAELGSGAAFVLDALGFDARVRASRAVVVGEGRLDRQTLAGKAWARSPRAPPARRPVPRDRRLRRAAALRAPPPRPRQRWTRRRRSRRSRPRPGLSARASSSVRLHGRPVGPHGRAAQIDRAAGADVYVRGLGADPGGVHRRRGAGGDQLHALQGFGVDLDALA